MVSFFVFPASLKCNGHILCKFKVNTCWFDKTGVFDVISDYKLEITFTSELHFCSNIVTLLSYKEWKYTYFLSETLRPPKNFVCTGL